MIRVKQKKLMIEMELDVVDVVQHIGADNILMEISPRDCVNHFESAELLSEMDNECIVQHLKENGFKVEPE